MWSPRSRTQDCEAAAARAERTGLLPVSVVAMAAVQHEEWLARRRGFDADRISAIKRAYRTLYVAGLPLAEAKQQLTEQARDSNDVKAMLDFIEHAERPLLR